MSVLTSPLWSALEAAAATGGTLHGGDDWAASGISIDTRALAPGDLFVALKDVRDGHDFLGAAAKAGASAALVSRVPDDAPKTLALLGVTEPLKGLEALGIVARERHFGKLIAVTGSAGKTSTKEMLRTALGATGSVHAAMKSFNNHIGVPVSLASLPSTADFGVFEVGMNHPGEIAPLAALVRPHASIITTVAAAHLEAFDSMEGIAAEKAQIMTGLRPGGAAVLPADNPHYSFLRAEAERFGVTTIVPFGQNASATDGVHLTSYTPEEGGATVDGTAFGQSFSFKLNVAGKHHALNAMAVIGAALNVGAPLDQTLKGLEAFTVGEGRGATQEVTIGGKRLRIIDESYNANPASMAASLAVLANTETGPGGRRVAVLGEMKELGPTAPDLHEGLLTPVCEAGVNRLFLSGEGMTPLARVLPPTIEWDHERSADLLLSALQANLQDGDVVLFKGSNASGVGGLLAAFLAKANEAG